MIYFQDNHRTIYHGDSRYMELPDESIQCVVTSPPYWGLRKYAGVPDLVFGGKDDCHHEWVNQVSKVQGAPGSPKQASVRGSSDIEISGDTCSLCGAWRGQFGLEPTIELYVEHTLVFLKEIWRVLRKDGVVFWNIGDSYAGGKGQSGSRDAEYQDARHEAGESLNTHYQTIGGAKLTKPTDDTRALREANVKPKDMCLIPFRVALAAQAQGWWVRSDIIWAKPNPMPESVTDRPTNSYEHIFLFTKSARYYWDMEAVREANTWIEDSPSGMVRQAQQYRDKVAGKYDETDYGGNGTSFQGHSGNFKADGSPITNPAGRNLRDVWTFPTQPYKDAHFATFPEALPERCIKAGSKAGDTILDPFAGSGTTLLVAAKLGRKAIGYELSEKYCNLNRTRNGQGILSKV